MSVDAAAAAWGQVTVAPRLIAARENRVYYCEVTGKALALCGHRLGLHQPAEIEAERAWLEVLAAQGFPCCVPVRAKDGALVYTEPSGQCWTASAWHSGSMIADMRPFLLELGSVLGHLHTLTSKLPPLQRGLRWDAEGLLGPTPTWGPFWENPHFKDLGLVQAARTVLWEKAQSAAWEVGTIHGDPLADNVLAQDQTLTLLDFDDAGVGFLGYDLGVALVSYWDDPDLPSLIELLVGGYAKTRPKVDREALTRDIPLFITMRALASAGWVARLPEEDPRHRIYAKRAEGCIARFLDDDL